MLRTTEDVVELRHWAEAHGARPCREDATGRLTLSFGGEAGLPCDVGWAEFESAFVVTRCVFVYDDSPGARVTFVGHADEAHAFINEWCGASHAAGPPG